MGPGSTAVAGNRAEQIAFEHLISNGLRPVGRNFRRRAGEIDLILTDGETLVFVEVRFRSTSRFSTPALTVDAVKQRKIIRTAALFLAKNPVYANRTIRFDVVAVLGEKNQACTWIRDAFRPGDSAL